MVKPYTPRRGDVVLLSFDPQSGHEQKGKRPALVLSDESYNHTTGLAVFCPITEHEKEYPFEVKIPSQMNVQGVILSDHLKNLDWRSRQASFKCVLPGRVTQEVLAKIKALLKIS